MQSTRLLPPFVPTQARSGDPGQGGAVSVGPIWHACIAIRPTKHRVYKTASRPHEIATAWQTSPVCTSLKSLLFDLIPASVWHICVTVPAWVRFYAVPSVYVKIRVPLHVHPAIRLFVSINVFRHPCFHIFSTLCFTDVRPLSLVGQH